MPLILNRCQYCHESAETLDERKLCPACSSRPACARCGMPNSIAVRSALCAWCHTEDNRDRPEVDHAHVAEIRAALGIGSEVPYLRKFEWGDELDMRWSGYRVELLHFPLATLPLRVFHPALPAQRFHPWAVIMPNAAGEDEERAIVRWRAWSRNVAGFAQVWWDPRRKLAHQERYDLRDLNPRRVADVQALLELLSDRVETSVREGTGRFRTAEECRANVLLILESELKEGRRPRAEDVETMLYFSPSYGRQLRRALSPYKWSALLREAQRRQRPEMSYKVRDS